MSGLNLARRTKDEYDSLFDALYHRKTIDLLKGAEMGEHRDGEDSWVPMTEAKLLDLRASMSKLRLSEIEETFRQMHGLATVPKGISSIPRPWVMQTMMQAYREMLRRRPKGR
jgi:hypothetical protein